MSKQFLRNILCASILLVGDVSNSVYAATNQFSAFSSTEERPLSFEEELPLTKSVSSPAKTPQPVIAPPVYKVAEKPKEVTFRPNNIIKPVSIEQPLEIISAQQNTSQNTQADTQKLTVESAKKQLLEAEKNADRIKSEKEKADKEYLANVNKARQLKEQLDAAVKLEKEQQLAAARQARDQKKADEKAKKAAEWQAYLVDQQKKKDDARLAKEAARNEQIKLKAAAEQKKADEYNARLKAEAERKAAIAHDANLKAEALRKAAAERDANLKAEAERAKIEHEANLKAAADRKAAAEKEKILKAQADLKIAAEKLKVEADLQAKLRADAAFKAAAEREVALKAQAASELAKKNEQITQSRQVIAQQPNNALAQKNVFSAQTNYPVAYSPPKPMGITPLQKATSVFGASAAKGSPIRQQILGYSASVDQIKAFDERYKYDISRISVLPKQIASIQLNPIIKLTGDQLSMFRTLSDKAAVEEYMAYHPLHAEALSNYIKRVMTLNGGHTNGLNIDAALMDEFTFKLGAISVPSASMSNASDQYLYISSRLNENDQVKFWNWVNAVRIEDKIQVPSWVKLVDVMYSH